MKILGIDQSNLGLKSLPEESFPFTKLYLQCLGESTLLYHGVSCGMTDPGEEHLLQQLIQRDIEHTSSSQLEQGQRYSESVCSI